MYMLIETTLEYTHCKKLEKSLSAFWVPCERRLTIPNIWHYLFAWKRHLSPLSQRFLSIPCRRREVAIPTGIRERGSRERGRQKEHARIGFLRLLSEAVSLCWQCKGEQNASISSL